MPLNPALPGLSCEGGTEPVPPGTHCLVPDIDAVFEQQVFDLGQKQGIMEVHHHRRADDRW